MGLSCFAFAPPAAAFWAVASCLTDHLDKDILPLQEQDFFPGIEVQTGFYGLLGLMYTLVLMTSYLADYLFIKREHRSSYGGRDQSLFF